MRKILSTLLTPKSFEKLTTKTSPTKVNGRMSMSTFKKKLQPNTARNIEEGKGLVFHLMRKIHTLVETRQGETMTFMEWLQSVVDYKIVGTIGSTHEDLLFITSKSGKEEACKEHIPYLIRQAKIHLDQYAFTDVMDEKIQDLQEDINTPSLRSIVMQSLEGPGANKGKNTPQRNQNKIVG